MYICYRNNLLMFILEQIRIMIQCDLKFSWQYLGNHIEKYKTDSYEFLKA